MNRRQRRIAESNLPRREKLALRADRRNNRMLEIRARAAKRKAEQWKKNIQKWEAHR